MTDDHAEEPSGDAPKPFRGSRLARKTELRGSSSLQRVSLRRRAPLRSAQRFPPRLFEPGPPRSAVARLAQARAWPADELRELVIARAEYSCDRCAKYLPGQEYSIQHRRSRGAGGTAGHVLDTPANWIVLCGSGVTGCHGRVETQERAEAYAHGFAIKGRVIDPATHPIFRHLREWVIPSVEDGVGVWLPAEPIAA